MTRLNKAGKAAALILSLVVFMTFSGIWGPGIYALADEAARADENARAAADVDFSSATFIEISGADVRVRNGEKGDMSYYEGVSPSNILGLPGIFFNGRQLILGAGSFVLSGELEGSVDIKAGKKEETLLALNGFSLTNPEDEALTCEKTKLLTVYLMDGTENLISSGEEIEINEECRSLTADATGGAVHLKAQTVVAGSGTLDICGYINNGLQGSKDLTVNGGILNITAASHGIKVNDTYYGNGGTISIRCGGDGIKASDEGTEAKAAVFDEETGELVSEAVEEAPASGSIIINAGEYSIDSYDDSMQALLDLTVNGGNLTLGATGTYNSKGSYTKTHSKVFSAKGLKSDGTLTVNNGLINVKSYNNAFSSSELLEINGGIMSLYCGNAGIHSDVEININGGMINIENSYEGIEANKIIINDGVITIFAWDDGMNANGGRGFGSRGGRSSDPGEMPELTINGGDIYVNAMGDGVDSNGNLTVNGGKMVVDGPTDNWNGPLDAGTENGGLLTVNGGTIFAGGSSGMAESFSSKSEQLSFQVFLNAGYKEGSEIRVFSGEGEELFSHSPARGGTSIVFSAPDLVKDETYILEVDGQEYEVPLTSISTKVNVRKR